MLSLAQNEYTAQEVTDALHARHGAREISFRYDLLDKNDVKKCELTTVESGEVDLDSLATIHRTAKFTIRDDDIIDWLSDRIQPFARLKMPDGGYVEYPLGIFLLSSPKRKDQNNKVYRDVDAFDGIVVLRDDKFTDRYTVTTGTRYYDAIVQILTDAGITKYNIEQTDKVLPNDVEFPPGKEKIFAINELLRQINYFPLHVDPYGYYTSSYYQSPAVRASDYTYVDDRLSVTFPEMEEELDLYELPNKFVVVRSNAVLPALRSEYTNYSSDNPISTTNRGRTILDYREVQDMADQQALDAYTQRIAFEASQVYGTLNFKTAIMPMHDFRDVLTINYSLLGINDKYLELGWKIPLESGGQMEHNLRKVVSI